MDSWRSRLAHKRLNYIIENHASKQQNNHLSFHSHVLMLATIDVGSNTVLLLVAEKQDGQIIPHYEEAQFGYLGRDTDENGNISKEAMQRVADILTHYKQKAYALGAHAIRLGATSASRDAKNQRTLTKYIFDKTQLRYRILSGDEEAQLTFKGGLAMLPDMQECVLMDIGGGSTELIHGNREEILWRFSYDAGSTRIRKRFFSQIPPKPEELSIAENWLWTYLDDAQIPKGLPLVAVAGVGTVVALVLAQKENISDLASTDFQISYAQIQALRQHVSSLKPQEVLALSPTVLHGRSEIFIGSLLILETVMRKFSFPTLSVSTGGLRHGLFLERD